MNHSHEGFIHVEEQRGTWQGITTTQKDLGLKKSREFGCSVLRSALWEGLKLVEITAAPPAQEGGFHSTPRFSLLGNDGKLGMGFPGAGNTQPGSHQVQGIDSSAPPSTPGLTCWRRRRPRGSEGRGCPRRRSARRGLGCSCAVKRQQGRG